MEPTSSKSKFQFSLNSLFKLSIWAAVWFGVESLAEKIWHREINVDWVYSLQGILLVSSKIAYFFPVYLLWVMVRKQKVIASWMFYFLGFGMIFFFPFVPMGSSLMVVAGTASLISFDKETTIEDRLLSLICILTGFIQFFVVFVTPDGQH